MATQLSRTFGENGNQRKFTISFWVKRTKLSFQCALWGSGGSSSYASSMFFSSDDTLRMWNYFNGAYQGRKYSSAKFRDTNAWYHIVARVDTASSTASERMRMYVNGEEVTALSQSDNPNQNQTFEVGHNGTHYIGGYGTGAEAELLMSHFHYCDGQSYAPTEFGETDSTTGEWKIKTDTSVSYGTTGAFILEDGNSVTDQSGLGHNWTVANGTLTKTEDNPSNVFAILNAITPSSNNNRAGGTRHFNNSGGYDMRHSTLAVTTGKYYSEFYIADMTGGFTIVGIQDTTQFDDYNFLTSSSRGYGYRSDGTKGNNNSSSSFGNSFTSGDYIGVAVDLDNNKIYFSKNGVWQNSGDPTSGATGTGSAFDITDGYDYCIATSSNDAGTDQITDVNFGNGYFNVTAVSSAGTNASGNGIFEYDVPTGYTALSTKGLNT